MWHPVARGARGARTPSWRPTCRATATRSGREPRRGPRRRTPSARWPRDLVAAMAALGHERSRSPATTAAGGSRTGWRSTSPEVVTRLAVLDIVPTGEIWRRADDMFAIGYWHWAVPRAGRAAARADDPRRPRRVLGRDRADGDQGGRRPLPGRRGRRLPRAARRPGHRRGDLRGLPRRRDDRPRARRRRPRRGARSPARSARCGAAPARCRASTRTRSSCGGRYAPGVTGPGGRGRVALPRRGRARRGRGRPRRLLRRGARRAGGHPHGEHAAAEAASSR